MRLSLQQKEQFFHEMSELLRSGRSVPETLELIAASRSADMREVARAMQQGGGDGSAGSYFAAVPTVFGPLDREIVQGGEASGRMDDALRYLSEYHGSLARVRRRILTSALYPFFLLHFGALVFAIPQLMSGNFEGFVAQILGFLGVFYALVALFWLAFRAVVRAAEVNPAADRILQSIPALGGARIALVGSRFCMLMGILVKAGGGILGAMSRSALASGSARFQRGTEEVIAAVQGGNSLGAAVAHSRAFPESIDRAFQIGETSGRLDEEMTRQAQRFSEQFNHRLDLLSGGFGKMIFLAVAITLGWKVISYYLGYFQTMNSLLQ